MTLGKIMFAVCVVAFVIGTVGFVNDLRVKSRQRKQEKHYAALHDAAADNE